MALSDNFRKVEAANARGQMAAASPAAPNCKGLPPEDPQALFDQAINLRNEGKYPEARALFERLVAMMEAAPARGPEHPQVAVSSN